MRQAESKICVFLPHSHTPASLVCPFTFLFSVSCNLSPPLPFRAHLASASSTPSLPCQLSHPASHRHSLLTFLPASPTPPQTSLLMHDSSLPLPSTSMSSLHLPLVCFHLPSPCLFYLFRLHLLTFITPASRLPLVCSTCILHLPHPCLLHLPHSPAFSTPPLTFPDAPSPTLNPPAPAPQAYLPHIFLQGRITTKKFM